MRVLINFIIRFHSVIFRKFYLIASNMEETINQFQFESNENVFQMLFATRLRNITATCYSIGFPWRFRKSATKIHSKMRSANTSNIRTLHLGRSRATNFKPVYPQCNAQSVCVDLTLARIQRVPKAEIK